MSESPYPLNKKNKFLFDLHNFDVPEEPEEEIIEEEEIEVEPPPPTFSEEELEAAKAIAHASGRMEGINEEKGKREQVIAELLSEINEKFSTLNASEIYRERQYEEESLKLGSKIIDVLAPSLQDRLGKEALRSALQEVLQSQAGHTEIRLEVHPDTAADIDQLIESIWPDKDDAPNYKVAADSSLEKGACALSWKDGGMVRDPIKTANDIKTSIEALLVDQVLTNPASSMNSSKNNAIKNQDNDKMSEDQPKDQNPNDQTGEPND